MKNQILNEITKKGIFISDQLLNDFEKKDQKKDFQNKKDEEFRKINTEEEIKKFLKHYINFYKEII